MIGKKFYMERRDSSIFTYCSLTKLVSTRWHRQPLCFDNFIIEGSCDQDMSAFLKKHEKTIN